MHDFPLLILVCIEGRPEALSVAQQVAFYGSVLPAAWSLMLALRARGLGSTWTTLHLLHEDEAARRVTLRYTGLLAETFEARTPGERSASGRRTRLTLRRLHLGSVHAHGTLAPARTIDASARDLEGCERPLHLFPPITPCERAAMTIPTTTAPLWSSFLTATAIHKGLAGFSRSVISWTSAVLSVKCRYASSHYLSRSRGRRLDPRLWQADR
jgi:hypothetical protein